MLMLGIALGDAATWVAAIGTVGTLAASLHLLYGAVEDRRVEQARLVSAWMERMPMPREERVLTYRVRNDSQLPRV